MDKRKKVEEDSAKEAGVLFGDYLSQNARISTNVSFEEMNLLSKEIEKVSAKEFEIAKGNLFEYIEVAKFNRDAAQKRVSARAVATDAIGDPHASADIIITEQGQVVKKIQAKFCKTSKNGIDASAQTSVYDHTGMSSMQLRLAEEAKIHCAREHFKAISSQNVVYDVVDSYQALLNKVMK